MSDQKGNLIYQEHIDLVYHGTGRRAQTEMEQKINRLVKHCKEKNWELIGENLDFIATKAGMRKGRNKREKNFNRIVHTLDYRRYMEILERVCKREGIKITFIPPYNTSVNGLSKFGASRKLNRHQKQI